MLYDRMPPCPERAEARRSFKWINEAPEGDLSPQERMAFRAERASWASFVGPPKTTTMVRMSWSSDVLAELLGHSVN